MHIILLDTETTDLKDPRLVQLGYKDLASGEIVNELFKPPVVIGYGAMSTHHITNEMVSDKPAFVGSETHRALNEKLASGAILVAHNAPFDIGTLNNEGIAVPNWIDTCRVAQHTIEAEQHKLQYLRYFLALPIGQVNAHDALDDVLVLEQIFAKLKQIVAEKYQLNEEGKVITKMMELSQTPLLLKTINFGKYKGMNFAELANLDHGYLDWLYKNESQKPENEQNQNMIYTLKYYLGL